MGKAVLELVTNLRGGVNLCRFKKLGPENFCVSVDQLFLLIFATAALSIIGGYFTHLPEPSFNIYAFTSEGFSIAVLLLSTHIVARYILRRPVFVALSVLMLSVGFIFSFIWYSLELTIIDHINATTHWWVIWAGYMVWLLATLFWCVRTVHGSVTLKVPASLLAMVFTWILPVWYLASGASYWYSSDTSSESDSYSAYRDLNAERILFSQSDLLKRDLSNLESERPGIIDLYFVGVGAYATQDVFLKETTFAKKLFDERFDTLGRSINLINNLKTYTDAPLATATNLEATLNHIGSMMNKDEDVLVLYMTSHGSSDHEFSMNFWPLPLNDVTPAMLKEYLENSGIKWRVLMISACYSGGFLEPLKTESSAIATAAASDRQSFGCSNARDFTYFGEALLKNQLQNEYSLPSAFSQAGDEITAREKSENLTASKPQFFVGSAIAPVLDTLSIELRGHSEASLACGEILNPGQPGYGNSITESPATRCTSTGPEKQD